MSLKLNAAYIFNLIGKRLVLYFGFVPIKHLLYTSSYRYYKNYLINMCAFPIIIIVFIKILCKHKLRDNR